MEASLTRKINHMITELGLLGQHQIKELETEFNHMASDIVDYMYTMKPPPKELWTPMLR